MTDQFSRLELTRQQQMLWRIARRPGFCCCCVCLEKEDRRRARRIFRLTRKVTRTWRREEEARMKADAVHQEPETHERP